MIDLALNRPYHFLTEEQKICARAAKKRWRNKNPEKQRALTIAWQQRNRARINKQYRDRYTANPEFYRAKLKAKRARMGQKYRTQVKRARIKMRSTPEGMLDHRMSQSVREALRGAKRRCKWACDAVTPFVVLVLPASHHEQNRLGTIRDSKL